MDSVELVHLSRGQIAGTEAIESIHLGRIAVVEADGHVLYTIGDVSLPVHLRSTAKPFQLLPFIQRNLHEAHCLEGADISLMMGSHGGEPQHTDRLLSLMSKLEVNESWLLCGVHPPTNNAAKKALALSGSAATVLHNNCSGKHCAMIAIVKNEGWPLESYTSIDHPLQKEIADLLVSLSCSKREDLGTGVDGCSAPTFILPLVAIARLYATLASASHGNAKICKALRVIFDAGVLYPEMIAGSKRLDTALMQVTGGLVFAKTGAEGGYALAIAPNEKYPKGLGIAIKIIDGDPTHRARNAVVLSLLLQLGIVSRELLSENADLFKMLDGKITNFSGIRVGEIKTVFKIG